MSYNKQTTAAAVELLKLRYSELYDNLTVRVDGRRLSIVINAPRFNGNELTSITNDEVVVAEHDVGGLLPLLGDVGVVEVLERERLANAYNLACASVYRRFRTHIADVCDDRGTSYVSPKLNGKSVKFTVTGYASIDHHLFSLNSLTATLPLGAILKRNLPEVELKDAIEVAAEKTMTALKQLIAERLKAD